MLFEIDIEGIKRFLLDNSIPEPNTGCRLWLRGLGKDGYATCTFQNPKRSYRVHRLSYMIFIGELENDEDVHHSCETPPCIEPFHLMKLKVTRHRSLHKWKGTDTHCLNGHDQSIYGTSYLYWINGEFKRRRSCKACSREKSIKLYRKKSEEKL